MGKQIRLVLVFGAFFLCSWQPLTAQQDTAIAFLQSVGLRIPEAQTRDFFTEEHYSGELIILESQNPPCFVLLSSGKQGFQVLGYSTSTRFTNPETTGIDPEELFSGLDLQKINQPVRTKTVNTNPIGPLITTRWSQGNYFNQYCPVEVNTPNGRAWVGCVPVALGQIINYFGPQNSFILDASYQSRDYGWLTAWADGYPWEKMLDQPLDIDLDVSRLLADLGVLVHANYSVEGTSASTGMALKGLHELGYSEAYRVRRQDYTATEWMNLLYENLINYAPVFVAGGGHAFICDGFDSNGFLHFNLGGAGTGDGYYSSSVIYGFTVQEAIVGIFPSSEVESPKNLSLSYSDSGDFLTWQKPHAQLPDFYRIYIGSTKFLETSDTSLNLSILEPGTAVLKVSAVKAEEESPWIGPAYYRKNGRLIPLADPVLAAGIREAMGGPALPDPIAVLEGDLADLIKLRIPDSLSDPSSLRYFRKLQSLEVHADDWIAAGSELFSRLPNLQVLSLSNLDTGTNPDFTEADKLVHLLIKQSQLDHLDFLPPLKNLRFLRLINSELDDSFPDLDLSKLESLEISSSKLKNISFIGSMSKLKSLKVSDNQIQQIVLSHEMEQIRDLWLDGNQLTGTDWLAYFPNLRYLNINRNRIQDLGFHNRLPYLKQVEAKNNRIRSLRFSFDYPFLEFLDLSSNAFKEFPVSVLAMKALWKLDISKNQLSQIPGMGSLALRELDLSENLFTRVPELSGFRRLQKLNLSKNHISDIQALMEDGFHEHLGELLLMNNPLSEESFRQVVPLLQKDIKAFYVPEEYEPSAPCYPNPGRSVRLNARQVELRWENENKDASQRYDVYVGEGDVLQLYASELWERKLILPIENGRIYRWQVRNRIQDETFYSGIYEISTLQQIGLPYSENFENYPNNSGFSTSSPVWRISKGDSDTYQDAQLQQISRISSGQFLHIFQTTDIALDLDHLQVPVLWVGMKIYVPEGKSAHFVLSDLAGMQLDVFLHRGSGEVLQNGALKSIFTYPEDQWVSYEVAIHAKNNRIFMKKDQESLFNERWEFHDQLVHLESLVFKRDHQALSRSGANYDYFLDDISIRTVKSTGVEDYVMDTGQGVQFLPNPVQDQMVLKGISPESGPGIFYLHNSLGQEVQSWTVRTNQQEFPMDFRAFPDGVYFGTLVFPDQPQKSFKILINRGL